MKKTFSISERNILTSALLAFQNEMLFTTRDTMADEAKYQLTLLRNNLKNPKLNKYSYSKYIRKLIKKIEILTP